jgi:salicylate hydroxylase
MGPSVRLRLLDILHASTPEVNPRWDTPLVRAELLDEAVRVQLESGPMETYDFVVGADGVHSSLRAAVLPEDSHRRSRMTEASLVG